MDVDKAEAIAVSWVAVSDDREPILPVLALMAPWMRATVAPALADVAKAPWQLAQSDAYSVAPLVTGVGVGVGVGVVVTGVRAVTMACCCALLRLAKEPMPPVPALIAACKRTRVTPILLDVARAPWQPAQLLAYRATPSTVGVGVGVGVGAGAAGFRAVTIACCSALVRAERKLIPPVLFAMAVCNLPRVIPFLLETAKAP